MERKYANVISEDFKLPCCFLSVYDLSFTVLLPFRHNFHGLYMPPFLQVTGSKCCKTWPSADKYLGPCWARKARVELNLAGAGRLDVGPGLKSWIFFEEALQTSKKCMPISRALFMAQEEKKLKRSKKRTKEIWNSH